MAQRGHVGDALADQIAVDSGRRTERGDAVLVDDGRQLSGVKVVKVVDHHGAAHQPLAVQLSPGSFGPSGFRHREMKAAVLCLLPVFRRHDMGQRIGEIVDHSFGIAGGSGGEIEQHGIGDGRFPAGESGVSLGCLRGKIAKTFRVLLYAPQDTVQSGFFYGLPDFIRRLILRRTDYGVYPGGPQPVYIVPDRQHMGGRNHGNAQLMQGDGGKPVFIVAFQHHHNPAAPFQPGTEEDICHPVAAGSDIGKGKGMGLIFRVAPHNGGFIRGGFGDGIRHVIAEIKVFRVIQLDALKPSLFIRYFPAKFLINAHIYSLPFGSRPEALCGFPGETAMGLPVIGVVVCRSVL